MEEERNAFNEDSGNEGEPIIPEPEGEIVASLLQNQIAQDMWDLLRLRTICYIEPVLAFGTEQDIIVNSRRLSPQRSQRSDLVEFGELHKECLLRKRYCLSEFESKVYQSRLTKF
jgi:hypothetical protein